MTSTSGFSARSLRSVGLSVRHAMSTWPESMASLSGAGSLKNWTKTSGACAASSPA